MNDSQLLLIDLSALAHQIWHISGNEPDPSFVSTQLVASVRGLASQHPHAAICCDSGKSFRADLDPTYKAQRDTENRAPLRHQMDVACETLAKDGFPVWRVKGFEADDLIATATAQAVAMDGDVLIASADKDLLQLVTDRVTFKSTSPNTNGKLFTPADVFDKFGVKPEAMGDLLALIGDKSDNIRGADNIGQVIGARLLAEHGTLAALYAKMEQGVVAGVTPGIRTSLMEFKARWPLVASLIALRTDAPIPFAEIAAERVAAPMEMEAEMEQDEPLPPMTNQQVSQMAENVARVPFQQGNDANDAPLPFTAPQPTQAPATPDPRPAQRIEPKSTDIAYPGTPAPPVGPIVDFSQQLEPRNMEEAARLAGHMFRAKLFNAYGTWEGVFSTILAGRELGIPAMASLRAFHIVESRPTMSADTMAALVLKSGKAKYFRCTERTDARCTFVTQRLPVEDYPEQKLTVTIEEMRAAWRKDVKAWDNSGWGKTPAAMLVAACKRTLARLEYPDVVGNIYDSEEVQ